MSTNPPSGGGGDGGAESADDESSVTRGGDADCRANQNNVTSSGASAADDDLTSMMVHVVEHDDGDGEEDEESPPPPPAIATDLLAEIKRQVAQPSPWGADDPDRKLQFLTIKAELRQWLGRRLTSAEKAEVRNRLRPLAYSFSSVFAHSRSLLNMTTESGGGSAGGGGGGGGGASSMSADDSSSSSSSAVFSPMRRSRNFTVTDRDTGAQYSVDEVEKFFPLHHYDTWTQGEEVTVVLRDGPTGVHFAAEWGRIGEKGDVEHYPLRIKEFVRRPDDHAPQQLEATGLLSVGDMVVAINGKSVRGRPWEQTAHGLQQARRPLTITFEKRPRLRRGQNARSVRRKIVRGYKRVWNKELRQRLRATERRLRAALQEPEGIKILAGEMRFNNGSLSLAKYTLIYNLQRAIVRGWVAEYGEASLKAGPPPGTRTLSTSDMVVAKRAAEALRRKQMVAMAERGSRLIKEVPVWGMVEREPAPYEDSRSGYDGDLEGGSSVFDPDDTLEFTPVTAKSVRRSSSSGGARGDGGGGGAAADDDGGGGGGGNGNGNGNMSAFTAAAAAAAAADAGHAPLAAVLSSVSEIPPGQRAEADDSGWSDGGTSSFVHADSDDTISVDGFDTREREHI